jgi:hypothetical protein
MVIKTTSQTTVFAQVPRLVIFLLQSKLSTRTRKPVLVTCKTRPMNLEQPKQKLSRDHLPIEASWMNDLSQ